MGNPYKVDPGAFRKKRMTAQNESLVSLQVESTQPPPSIRASAYQAIYFGPTAGQPTKAGGDVKPGWGKTLLRILFWLWFSWLLSAAFLRFFQ